jgi:hypothetical protein
MSGCSGNRANGFDPLWTFTPDFLHRLTRGNLVLRYGTNFLQSRGRDAHCWAPPAVG